MQIHRLEGFTGHSDRKQLVSYAKRLSKLTKSIYLVHGEPEKILDLASTLKKVIKGRTSIIIAHRLSTIQHVDRIIVMHKGRIVETGNHFELLEKKGLYYDLYRLQYQ